MRYVIMIVALLFAPPAVAQEWLAEILRLLDRATEQNDAEWQAELLQERRRAGEHGDAAAQFYLGVIYDFGRRVKQNHADAMKWYRLAAEQDHGTHPARTTEGSVFF